MDERRSGSRDTLHRIFEHHAAQAYAALDQKPAETIRQAQLADQIAHELARRRHPVATDSLAHLYWNRGAAYYSLQRYASAHRWYRRALTCYRAADAANQELQSTLLLNLAFSAEQLHRLEEGLRYAHQSFTLSTAATRGAAAERLAWLQVMLGDLGAARTTLSHLVADAAIELTEYHCRVLLVAFRYQPDVAVLERLLSCEAVRRSRTLTAQLAVVLSRSGRAGQAAPLLETSPELRNCLGNGGEPPSPGPMTLHPILSSTSLNHMRIRPIVAGASGRAYLPQFEAALAHLPSFHEGEFGGSCRLEVAPMASLDHEFAVHELYDGVDVESYLRRLSGVRRKAGEIVILGLGRQSGSGPLGFTCGALSVLGLPRLLYSETLLAHEFYHASLELEHTDGEAEVEDPLSVMAPLECLTYLTGVQRRACLTEASVHRVAVRGERHLAEGRYREALSCLERALERDPEQRWVHVKMAEAWGRQGDLGRLTQVLLQAQELFGGAWARFELCQHLAWAGRMRAARPHMQGLKAWQQAHVYFECGHYRQARRAYERDKARGYAADGILYCTMSMGLWAAAQKQLDRLLQTSPWSWTLYARQAEIHAAQGDAAAARKALRQARQRTDDPARLGWHRLSVHRLLGDWQAAVAWLQRNTQERGVPRGPWLELGYGLWQTGQVEAAGRAFEKATRVRPPYHAETALGAAWVSYLEGGATPDLARRAERLVRRLPYSVPALHLLVNVANRSTIEKRLLRLSPRSLAT